MKLTDMLLVGGIGILAYALYRASADSGGSPSSDTVSPTTSPSVVTPVAEPVIPNTTQVVNKYGQTVNTRTQAQEITQIQHNNGVNTPIAVNWNNNPLFTAYQAGGTVTPGIVSAENAAKLRYTSPTQTFVSARQPTNAIEHEAATHTNAIRALSESTGISQSEAFDRLNR